ncbi:hypothetical protein FQV39_18190 [Bosea sp. F3-2]|uniref:TadE/TadG family type IV pilus assembly protein n=1 Tax=Bosea sp. F3-2 TaxID=2599640 RepID=UPI0011EBA789|nr:hypothetical protein [Bosea sp. F3-2]QEL24295.1 hypothetical protein FQV39_18190 [Bosea sp. F3-2]
MMRFGSTMNLKSLASLWRRFRDERDGVAAIEAAIALPVMVVAYVGVVNISQMVAINRKVTQLTSALSDLTARLQTVPTAEISNIFKAAETILLPYDSRKAKMVIASIVIDANRVAKVCWSNSYPAGTTAPNRGDTESVPDSVRIANTSVIMARASYEFTPVIGNGMFSKVTLGDHPIYTRPRNGKADGNASIEQIVRSDVTGCPQF